MDRWGKDGITYSINYFNYIGWNVFDAAATDLDELSDTVTSYISFCEDVCAD